MTQAGETGFPPPARPDSHADGPGVAPRAAAVPTPGLAALHASLERVVAMLGLRALTIVVDDPDLGRQAFRAGEGPFEPGVLTGPPGCRADPPLSPDRIDGELLVELCAASLRVEVLREGGTAPPDTAELALRRLPGVHAVVVERDDELLVVQVYAAADAPPDLARAAARAAAPLASGPLVVEVVRGIAPPSAPASPEPEAMAAAPAVPVIVAVRSVPELGEVEVHVRQGEVRTIGRAPMAQGLAGAVEATLDGLRQIAPGLDLGLAWVRTIETTVDRRFVVSAALHHVGSRTMRYGLGTGGSPIEGAARAALDAVTRTDEPAG